MHLARTLNMHIKQYQVQIYNAKKKKIISWCPRFYPTPFLHIFLLLSYIVPSLIVEQKKNPFGSYENNTLLSANAEWNSDNNKASCSHIIYHCLSHILYVTIHTISAPTHVEYTIKSEYISNQIKVSFPWSCHYRSNCHFQISTELSPRLAKIVWFIKFQGTTSKLILVIVHILHAR